MSAISDAFTAIANAIRNKKGVTTKYTPEEMPNAISSISTGTDTSDATAGAGDILSTKTAYGASGKITGTMINQGATSASINPGVSYTIPAGYHNGEGVITANNANLQAKTASVTPSASYSNPVTQNATINPDSGYDGMSQVNVNVPMLRDHTLFETTRVETPTTIYNGDTSQSNSIKMLRIKPTKTGMSYPDSYLNLGPSSYMGDATAADVAAGKTFCSANGIQITGSLTTRSASDTNITNSITYQAGYYPTSWTVYVKSPSVPSWSEGTDAEIVLALARHYAGEIDITEYWNIGDERVINLKSMPAMSGNVDESHVSQTISMVLMNKGGKTLTTPINGHTECAFIVGQKDLLYNPDTSVGDEVGRMNSSNTNSGGWDSCERRTWCNSIYKNAFPSYLVGIFKEHQNITASGSGSTKTTSNDYFALPSEKEVFGTTSYANSTAEANNKQFEYYKDSDNRIKSKYLTSWWERSPRSGNSNSFCYVNTSNFNANASADYASYTYGIAPFGVI